MKSRSRAELAGRRESIFTFSLGSVIGVFAGWLMQTSGKHFQALLFI